MAKNKKVLVLDDEEMILELVQDIFKTLDFRVYTAQKGRHAIKMFKEAFEKGEPFDLVVFDMTLPGELDGVKTLEEVRKIDPGVKAIVSSGYAADDFLSRAREFGFDAAVPKPYSISVLRQTVLDLLED